MLSSLVLLFAFSPAGAASTGPNISVSPKSGIVGSTILINGSGFPPNTGVYLGWVSENASWITQPAPTPQVTGIKSTPLVFRLGTTTTDGSGSLSVSFTVPTDYGGSHAIQAYAMNGTAISPVANFKVAPSFGVSTGSGPAGSPIRVTAKGLGIGVYSTNYCLYWDNNYVGYMTAVSTGGVANFTFYASGTPGTHYISIFEGNNGPGYLNPGQNPSVAYYDPPYIPFYANFTVTSQQVSASSVGGFALTAFSAPEAASLALLAAALGGGLLISTKKPEERAAISRIVAAVAVIVMLAIGGAGILLATQINGGSSSPSSSGPRVVFSPVATVERPQIMVQPNSAATGPRIIVTPTIASVGDPITISGQGFPPNTQLPLFMTTNKGNNLSGYKLVDQPLSNVTTGSDGSFSLAMKAPPALGGIHYIAAGNLTQNSNGTLFIQRTATISVTQGPEGTKIIVNMQGVGWDYNTNIVAVDYDNNYIGYACGFNSGGNVTMTIVATGAPGIHDIDIWPSVWWGPMTTPQQLPGQGQLVNYDNPLLTPQDHPELMPAFHFTFLITPP